MPTPHENGETQRNPDSKHHEGRDPDHLAHSSTLEPGVQYGTFCDVWIMASWEFLLFTDNLLPT